MNEVDADQWEREVVDLIEELFEAGILSHELQEEIESLLEDGLYDEAGIIAVKNTSRTNALAD